jgi:hypothetical protein
MWTSRTRAAVFASNAFGFVALALSAIAASATHDLSARVAWCNVAVIGFIVAGLGDVLFLTAGRRAIGRRRVELLGARFEVTPSVASAMTDDRCLPVAAARMTRYHRPTCLLMRGKPARRASAAHHQRAGLAPCGLCLP